MKNMFVSIILSVILPGIGHFYLGRFLHGLFIILGFIMIGFLSNKFEYISLLGFILWVYTIYSAYKITKSINNTSLNNNIK